MLRSGALGCRGVAIHMGSLRGKGCKLIIHGLVASKISQTAWFFCSHSFSLYFYYFCVYQKERFCPHVATEISLSFQYWLLAFLHLYLYGWLLSPTQCYLGQVVPNLGFLFLIHQLLIQCYLLELWKRLGLFHYCDCNCWMHAGDLEPTYLLLNNNKSLSSYFCVVWHSSCSTSKIALLLGNLFCKCKFVIVKS